MKPMLARTYGPRYSSFPCFVQPKLNGIRALYQNSTFSSRDEILWHPNVLAHLASELSLIQSLIGDSILDGELYVHGWRLQRINSAVAVKRTQPTGETPNVEYHIFDVVNPNLTFSRRWLDLYNALQSLELPHIKPVPTSLAGSVGDMDLHFRTYTGAGYEGIMLRPDGPYEFGTHLSPRTGTYTTFRSKYLWKHKQWQDDEFLCVGVTPGEGKADIGIGALICGAHPEKRTTPVPFSELGKLLTFKVGTGFSDEERIEYMKNPPIGSLVKVRYLELTADGIPFNPSFLAVLD